MALNIIIKNTFLDVEESDGSGSACGSTRRSSSVPRTWKPGFSLDKSFSDATPSIGSTAASDGELSDGQPAPLRDVEGQDVVSAPPTPPTPPMPKKAGLNPEAAEFQMPPAAEMLAAWPPTFNGISMIRLNPEARVFEPMPTPMARADHTLPPEISIVVSAAKQALLGGQHVLDAQVTEGALGQTTTITAEVDDKLGPNDSHEILGLAKAALLEAAANSQMTYVLGYGTVPFQDVTDSGFKAAIGSIPPSMQGSICWDTYQKGYCPRRALCRWCHPTETDLAQIRVLLKRAEPGGDRVVMD